jgi:hypothetical protein
MTHVEKASVAYKFVDKEQPPLLWYIEWVDHSSHKDTGWKNKEDSITPCTIISVGWILSEDKTSIYMANHLDPADFGHMGGQCVMKNCITKAVQIKEGWK